VPFSTSADANNQSLGWYRVGPAARVAVPSVAAEPTRRARLQRIATDLRRGEALWIGNKMPMQGSPAQESIVAFHDPDDVDKTLVPYFMLPSLPQKSADFIELAGMMDPRQPFVAAYLPSEMHHPATASSVADLAQHYATEIHESWPTGAIALGWWSAGPAIALAVAELLRDLGHAVPSARTFSGPEASRNFSEAAGKSPAACWFAQRIDGRHGHRQPGLSRRCGVLGRVNIDHHFVAQKLQSCADCRD